MLFVDLDDFKAINDTRGHADGDRAAASRSRDRLTACLRAGDTAARLGGDEFGVLLESVAGPPARCEATAAPRILEALAPAGRARAAGRSSCPRQRRHGDQRRRRTAASRSSCARPTSRCTRPSAAASAAREFYEAHLEGRDVPARAARPVVRARRRAARRDRGRARRPGRHHDGLPADHGPAHRARSRATSRCRASTASRAATPDLWFAQAHRYGLGYALEAKAIACRARARRQPARPAPT